MPSEDLKSYATSDTDFYTLLGVSFETSQKDIDRAWRRTALKYHPDKQIGDDPTAKEKFHLAQIGYDLLSDPASKAIYDNARAAKLQRKRQNELFEGRRRQMKDDLESREKGVKRFRDEDDEEKLEREIRRLAEDGKRRRKDREDALRRDMQDEVVEDYKYTPIPGSAEKFGEQYPTTKSGVSELDRTIKIRWSVDGDGGSITADRIRTMFSKFGKIESVDLLNPKMVRLAKGQKKQLAVVCMLLFKSIIGAHAAVMDFPRQEGSDWKLFDSVFWAANKEPDFINASQLAEGTSRPAPSTPGLNRSTRQWTDSRGGSIPSTPIASPQIKSNGLKSKPSFASFSAAAATSTPKGSPFAKGLGINSPSLEELTMIRLKNAEKKRLAAEIERQDAEEDAAAESKGVST